MRRLVAALMLSLLSVCAQAQLVVVEADRGVSGSSKYPIAVAPERVGKFPAIVKSGAGYFYDEVLEYRVSSKVRQDLTDHGEYVSSKWAPIADDLFNNRYVVDLATGRVLFLEYGGGQCRSTLVAPDFEKFIASIQVTQDE